MAIRVSSAPRRNREEAERQIPQLIDRLNRTNPGALTYRLDGERLVYEIQSADQLDQFSRDMMMYIDHDTEIPFRIVPANRDTLVDSWHLNTVDIDDLLRAGPLSFRMVMLHVLEERLRTPNGRRLPSARRILQRRQSGQAPSPAQSRQDIGQSFVRAHDLGRSRELQFLRHVTGDDSLRFVGSTRSNDGARIFRYRNGDRSMIIDHRFVTRQGRTTGSVILRRPGQDPIALQEFLQNAR